VKAAQSLVSSAIKENGELIPRPFRMCGFVPFNMPILVGLLLTQPTLFNTIFFQWINQSYNAGLNYGYKSPTSTYSDADLLKGYVSAVLAASATGMGLRHLTKDVGRGATGLKLIILNGIV